MRSMRWNGNSLERGQKVFSVWMLPLDASGITAATRGLLCKIADLCKSRTDFWLCCPFQHLDVVDWSCVSFAAEHRSAEECVNARYVTAAPPSGYISFKLGHSTTVGSAACPWQVGPLWSWRDKAKVALHGWLWKNQTRKTLSKRPKPVEQEQDLQNHTSVTGPAEPEQQNQTSQSGCTYLVTLVWLHWSSCAGLRALVCLCWSSCTCLIALVWFHWTRVIGTLQLNQHSQTGATRLE